MRRHSRLLSDKSRSLKFAGDPPTLPGGVPLPKRPQPMVPVEKQSAIRRVLGKVLGIKPTPHALLRQDRLKGLQQEKFKMLGTTKVTSTLYWYCVDLSFMHSDFQRLLPPPNARLEESGEFEFQMTRARNPVNLTKWMGYFLQFKTPEDAVVYYKETLGSELCGLPLKLKFVDPHLRGLHSPLLDKVPQISRRCHAIILGLPPGFSETSILRTLWDYDLIDDDTLAVERLPVDKVKYGGSPFLLRFKTEEEAERFVVDYDKQVFPYSDAKVYCECVD